MALTARGAFNGYWLKLVLKDKQGDNSSMTFELTSADYATAVTDMETITTAVIGVTSAVIVSRHLSVIEDQDTFVYPAVGDNSVKARIVFQLADRAETANRDIPSPQDGIFVAPSGPNNNVVDVLDAAVIAFAQLFQVGGQAAISDGELSDNIVKGQRVTRAKGMS